MSFEDPYRTGPIQDSGEHTIEQPDVQAALQLATMFMHDLDTVVGEPPSSHPVTPGLCHIAAIQATSLMALCLNPRGSRVIEQQWTLAAGYQGEDAKAAMRVEAIVLTQQLMHTAISTAITFGGEQRSAWLRPLIQERDNCLKMIRDVAEMAGCGFFWATVDRDLEAMMRCRQEAVALRTMAEWFENLPPSSMPDHASHRAA